MYLLFIAIALSIGYGICLLVCLIAFYAHNVSNLVELYYNMENIGRFPIDAYQGLGTLIYILILPFTAMVTIPSQILLGNYSPIHLAGFLIFAIIVQIISRQGWKTAIKKYSSASG